MSKIVNCTLGITYNIMLKDLNDDEQSKIIVESLYEGILPLPINLYVFEIIENGIFEKLDIYNDIDLENYFRYKDNISNTKYRLKDNFDYRKHIEHKLPN